MCHTSSPYYAVMRRNSAGITVLEVEDGGDGTADTREPALQRGGYGLNLVDQLSDMWGVHVDDASGHKTVWAALSDTRRL